MTLAAHGTSLAAFEVRRIPAGSVAPRSDTGGILARRPLPAGRIPRPGAWDLHHGLLAHVLLSVALFLAAVNTATAQNSEPIGLFAGDVRIALPGYKQDPNVAAALGVETLDLPTRGFGLVFGGHIYPARRGPITLGVGAELMRSGRSRAPETPVAGAVQPTVRTSFSAFSPQISFNFGSRQGWSYISGGLGWGRFTTELEGTPLPDAEETLRTINYGGGARWFLNEHVAVSLDLRFYAINPQEATLTRPAFPRLTIVAFNAGLGFK